MCDVCLIVTISPSLWAATHYARTCVVLCKSVTLSQKFVIEFDKQLEEKMKQTKLLLDNYIVQEWDKQVGDG